MKSLHPQPRFSDRWSHLYLEHGKLDVSSSGVRFLKETEEVNLPIDQLNLIMLGPGTSVTHEAVKVIADNCCMLSWVGEQSVKMYAYSSGGTFSSKRLLHQARLASNPTDQLTIAKKLYQKRFCDDLTGMNIEQIRGLEGQRVRESYRKHSILIGVNWVRRNYDQDSWYSTDLPNRALSAANSCLYGIVHSAIVAAGYSPALGFIHTGKMLSFVYDISDLYKTDLTIPLAFKESLVGDFQLERRVRLACRDAFHKFKLMEKILPDISEVLGVSDDYGKNSCELEGKAFSMDD